MGKSIDKLFISISVFILTFILAITIFHNSLISLMIGISICLVTLICLIGLGKNKKSKHLNIKNYDTYMIVKGITYQLDTLMDIYPNARKYDNHIVYDDNIIFPLYKFSNVSKDDILKVYRILEEKSIKRAYIICNNLDRLTINFANQLCNKDFTFIRSSELYKMLKSLNKLPTIDLDIQKNKLHLHDVILLLFSRSNAKRYLFSSIVLLSIGFFTPLRTYYFILSGISAIFVLISLFSKDKISDNKHLPK